MSNKSQQANVVKNQPKQQKQIQAPNLTPEQNLLIQLGKQYKGILEQQMSQQAAIEIEQLELQREVKKAAKARVQKRENFFAVLPLKGGMYLVVAMGLISFLVKVF